MYNVIFYHIGGYTEHLAIKTNENGFFLIDLKTKEAMEKYYGVKERFQYKLDDREAFIKHIAYSLKSFFNNFDNIVVPESSSDFIQQVISYSNQENKLIVIKKNSIDDVIAEIDTLGLQLKEKKAHLLRLKEMNNVFKINLMKSNQRRKYESLIFKKTELPQGKTLILDDSCFSGTTLRGLSAFIKDFEFLAIFSK